MNNNIPVYVSNRPYFDEYQNNRYNLPADANPNVYYTLFNQHTFNYISEQITLRLKGVHPLNKNIIVPNDTIKSVLDSFYSNYKRDPEVLIMMTISYLVDYIKSEYQMESQNRSLNIWVTNYPESSGIRQYAPIKLKNKRPTPFEFHYSY